MKIRNRYNNDVIFDDDAETMKETVENAVKSNAYLSNADLSNAYLSNADLSNADLRYAYLSNAYLSNITVSWSSHALLSEILWRVADTEPRQMVAAFIGRNTDWCWKEWGAWEHPEKMWAITELKKWVKDGDNVPDILTQSAP